MYTLQTQGSRPGLKYSAPHGAWACLDPCNRDLINVLTSRDTSSYPGRGIERRLIRANGIGHIRASAGVTAS